VEEMDVVMLVFAGYVGARLGETVLVLVLMRNTLCDSVGFLKLGVGQRHVNCFW
jgi:hypothetical protein